jgi:hypothetical protein
MLTGPVEPMARLVAIVYSDAVRALRCPHSTRSSSLLMQRTSLLACVFWSHASQAAASDAVELDYQASPTCPPREWLLPRVVEALGAFGLESSPKLVLHVSGKERQGFVGHLELAPEAESEANDDVYAAPERWTRTIAGARCDEVLSALVMSLSIHAESQPAHAAPAPRDAASEPPLPSSTGGPPATGSLGRRRPPRAADWKIGVLGGGHIRSSLSPALDFSARVGLSADRDHGSLSGAAESYGVSFSVGGARGAELPASFGDLEWEHRWWAVGAQACPIGMRLASWLRLEPCASLHGGRYEAALQAGSSSARWLSLAELTAQLRVSAGPWAGRLELGAFTPLGSLTVRRAGEAFYQQGVGVVAGVTATILPLTAPSGG